MRRIGATTALIGAIVGVLALAACGDRDDKGAEEQIAAPVGGDVFEGQTSQTLMVVRSRGHLNCGVNEGLVGFAYTDNRGQWRGFDTDFCRALAAATLGDAAAVRFVPLNTQNRFEALRSGRVDVLYRNTSWTMTRDAGDGLEIAGVNYYDGQGFLVRRSLNLTSASELNGARVCVQANSTSRLNLDDYFRTRQIEYTPVLVDSEQAARDAYGREDCDAFSADLSALAAARTALSAPAQHAILPDVISKEPLGPVIRSGDDAWADVVRWSLNALILAEELGVTSDNAAELAASSADPRIRRLLGVEGEFGAMLGLPDDWGLKSLEATGNYGEIFDRNLGSQSALDLARGLNAQWNAQPRGLMYGLPVR